MRNSLVYLSLAGTIFSRVPQLMLASLEWVGSVPPVGPLISGWEGWEQDGWDRYGKARWQKHDSFAEDRTLTSASSNPCTNEGQALFHALRNLLVLEKILQFPAFMGFSFPCAGVGQALFFANRYSCLSIFFKSEGQPSENKQSHRVNRQNHKITDEVVYEYKWSSLFNLISILCQENFSILLTVSWELREFKLIWRLDWVK